MSPETHSGLSIIIPAYNEGAAITQTVSALTQTLSLLNRPSEIIVVDDGSTDGTASSAQKAGARVIHHPANSGYGRSLLTGISAANHDVVAIADADGTYPVERLPELLAEFDKGFDMVVGARQGKNYVTSLSNRLLRYFFRCLAEYTCGRSIPDINSGFRVFYRKPVLAWRTSVSTGFSFTTTITLLFMLNNLLVSYVPVPYNKRVGDSKVRLFRDSLRSLQIMFTAIAQFNPLKLYLLLIVAHVVGTTALLFAALSVRGVGGAIAVYGIIAWNALCVILAVAILAVAVIKPSPTPVE